MAKQELPVEIREIDRVEVDNVDFPEAVQDQVLEQFAADASSSNHEQTRLGENH
jgi:hypothetical protein